MSTTTITLGSGVCDTITLPLEEQDISGLTVGSISTIDMSSYTSSTGMYNTICNTTSGSNGTSYYSSPYTISTTGTSTTVPWITTSPNTAGIQVKGDAEFDGDIKLKGKSLAEMLEKIESRLSILTPNPKKLEQYEALQKAYRHYKMLEALCEERNESDEDK